MTKRMNLFPSLLTPREINFLKVAGASFLLLCAAPQFAMADTYEKASVATTQQATDKITGTVVDETGEPIIGASIKVQGTTIGTITDLEGKFTLNVPKRKLIEVSFIGYKTQEVAIGKEHQLRITLEEDTKTLDEVIVVGYGTTSKRKTTAAIASVNTEDITKAPTANITQSLAGRAPGLLVNTSGGGLNNFSSISIRGGGAPLYVIDDVISEERDFRNLNAEDIDQITILKDAASTAVYGARAGNGIVMVVTKQGKAGKMSVNYSFNYNWSQPANMPKKLNSYDAAYYMNMSKTNDGLTAPYDEAAMEAFRTGSDPRKYPNVDWQKLCLNKFAPEMMHNLTVTGGSEKVKAYTSLGYYDQNSLYKGNTNTYQRYNFRNNLVMDFKEIGLKVNSSIEAYKSDLQSPNSKTGDSYYHTWGHIQNKAPWENGLNKNGQLYKIPDNPLMEISPDAGYTKSEWTSVIANLMLEWSVPFVPGLRLKALGNYRISNDKTKSWKKDPKAYDWDGNLADAGKPSLSKNYYTYSGYTVQGFANYDRTFNKVHTISATAGIEAYKMFNDWGSLSREEYLLDVDQIGAGPVSTAKNSSGESELARAGMVARVKYDYASKYVGEFSMRYDGSDNFPKGKRWGTFYAGSLAWVVSEEAFWKNIKDQHIFDQFKVRASYGEIGLDEGVGRYSYLQSYGLSDRGYLLSGNWYPGFSEGALVSKDITWYTTRDFNIGFDFGSLNNRLSGSVDYFRKSTKGYLTSPSAVNYTAPLGLSLPKVKSDGEFIRQGAEFILQWKEKRGDFEYTVSGNFTYFDQYWNINPNEAETDTKNPYKRNTQAKGYWGIGYTSEGFYTNQADIMNSPKRPSSVNLGAGDLKYADFNGDGIIDGADQHRIGKNSNPRGQYGINVDLNYKGWFMSMLWQGATSADFYMGNVIQGAGPIQPVVYDFQTDVWTPDNIDARYPRLRSNPGFNGSNNYGNSDFWLVNTGYIRLKTLSVGYDFKSKLLKRVAWLNKCTASLNGYNLLTFSGANKFDIDPEIGDGNLYTYPVSRVYSISLSLGF